MDAVPIVPPLFRAAKTRHFTSYKQATDHELLTRQTGEVDEAQRLLQAAAGLCPGETLESSFAKNELQRH
jgi:hypothetical protein